MAGAERLTAGLGVECNCFTVLLSQNIFEALFFNMKMKEKSVMM